MTELDFQVTSVISVTWACHGWDGTPKSHELKKLEEIGFFSFPILSPVVSSRYHTSNNLKNMSLSQDRQVRLFSIFLQVLVHCKGGINRSPCLLVAYLMKYEDLSLGEALSLVAAARPPPPSPTNFRKVREFMWGNR